VKKIAARAACAPALVGLAAKNFPEYAPRLRAILKSFGRRAEIPRLVTDGGLGAVRRRRGQHAAGSVCRRHRLHHAALAVARPFSPALPDVAVMTGLPTVRPSPHAKPSRAACAPEVDREKGSGRSRIKSARITFGGFSQENSFSSASMRHRADHRNLPRDRIALACPQASRRR